jgi:hypothetical protein
VVSMKSNFGTVHGPACQLARRGRGAHFGVNPRSGWGAQRAGMGSYAGLMIVLCIHDGIGGIIIKQRGGEAGPPRRRGQHRLH